MKRAASENSNAVGLFPFLAVLLCTMGALLVLLVVLAQRAGQRIVSQQSKSPAAIERSQTAERNDPEEAAALARQLEEVHSYQEQLRRLREQAEQRLRNEQLRLSHLEEHTRRLEHELARLSIAAQQLEATEENQSVDQEQAEHELARLQKLINETENRLEKLREEASGNRSYAIVPYQGPNGTYRKPIYIECSKEGITLHPEGLRLEANDFVAPGWPGNPLAAALRASREYLNARAAKAGEPEPPDPYPMLLVRPDGIAQYTLARAAITSWDADFGYEFIDADWKLEFLELPDPRLAQVQEHAVLVARNRLARLVRSAPSRFRGIGYEGGSSTASGGASGSLDNGVGGPFGEPNENGGLAQSNEGYSSDGSGSAADQSGARNGEEPGDYQYGAMGGDANAKASEGESELAGEPASAGGGSSDDQQSTLAQTGDQSAQKGSHSGSPGGSASSGSSSGGGSTPGGQQSNPAASMANLSKSSGAAESIAKSRGKNWAIASGAQGAVPIRRPIQVVVRKDRLALLPSRHVYENAEATGTVISLDQPTGQISAEFVEALRNHIDQWGLAGNGLYWRPVLQLHIGPDAEQTVFEITRLLRDSGVEVRR